MAVVPDDDDEALLFRFVNSVVEICTATKDLTRHGRLS